MRIRTATIADIPALCPLLESLFTQEVEFQPNRTQQLQGLTAILENSQIGDILVAETESQVIGMVNLLYTVSTALGSRVALLEDLIVAPESRGQGVGSKLIEQAIALAKTKDCRRITLLTDIDNLAAHRFYHRHGFHSSSMIVFRHSIDL